VRGSSGGFFAARTFGRAPVRVTLVACYNYNQFQPQLYQVVGL
jgi:hypothetical protein